MSTCTNCNEDIEGLPSPYHLSDDDRKEISTVLMREAQKYRNAGGYDKANHLEDLARRI
jgi:hypothetical protein